MKRRAERIGCLKTLRGILGHGHKDELAERERDIGFDIDGRRRRNLQMRLHDFEIVVADMWTLAGDHFVERDADRIKIGARVDGLALHLFGRHIGDGAQSGVGHGEAHIVAGACDAEVHQFYDALRSEHHVGGLNVAMNDFLRVGVGERGESLIEVGDRVGVTNRALMEAGGEGDAVDVLHDHDELVIDG